MPGNLIHDYLLGRRRLAPIIEAHYTIHLFTCFLVEVLPMLGS